ncbi:hypothetical protein AB0K35_03190 [Micromonospora sp. NPDC053740]|uniref:hypothetical protein n=1 Tax=Micromonospora sp. NPDC053740 TaxID=3155173 RepID=UPI00342D78E0
MTVAQRQAGASVPPLRRDIRYLPPAGANRAPGLNRIAAVVLITDTPSASVVEISRRPRTSMVVLPGVAGTPRAAAYARTTGLE